MVDVWISDLGKRFQVLITFLNRFYVLPSKEILSYYCIYTKLNTTVAELISLSSSNNILRLYITTSILNIYYINIGIYYSIL